MPCARTQWLVGLLSCVLLGAWSFHDRGSAFGAPKPLPRPLFLRPTAPSPPLLPPSRGEKAVGNASLSEAPQPERSRAADSSPVGNAVRCPKTRSSARFLFYRSEGCPGLLHKLASLRCAAEEARRLGRVLVLEPICVAPAHNRDLKGPNGEGLAMEPMVLLDLSDEKYLPSRCLPEGSLNAASMTVVRGDVPTGKIAKTSKRFLMRTGFSQRAGFWWYSVCEHFERKPKPLRWSADVLQAADRVVGRLGQGFVFVHVRRGDMVSRWRVCWPHLDADTQAGAIGSRLQRWFPSNTTLYVASNEWQQNFFLPLKSSFRVFTAEDFQADALHFVVGNNYLLFAVEQALSLKAFAKVETFREVAQSAGTPYYLARDPRHSVQCGMAPAPPKRKPKGDRSQGS